MAIPRSIVVGATILGSGLAGCQIAEEPAPRSTTEPSARGETSPAGDLAPEAGGMEQGRSAPAVRIEAKEGDFDEGSRAFTEPVAIAPWFACGNLGQVNTSTCQLPEYPILDYEYAIGYNSREPLPVVCTLWNRGVRLYNKTPYLIFSDNPTTVMRYGGAVFYTGTDASDDDSCASGQWRHRYWQLEAGNAVTAGQSNGCYGSNLAIYCRSR